MLSICPPIVVKNVHEVFFIMNDIEKFVNDHLIHFKPEKLT